MKIEDIAALREVQFIEDKLTSKLGELLCSEDMGKNVNDRNKDSVDAVKRALTEQCEQLKKQGIVEDYKPDVEVYMLWENWSWKKKAYWWWKHRLGFGKKEIQRYSDFENFLIAQLVGEEDENRELMREVLGDYEKHYFKWWYEKSPKTIAVANFTITPKSGLEYVMLNFTV
jgi:hypothetical protein